MVGDNDEEDECMSVYSELVDDTFTIENITALTKSVKSKTQDVKMLQWQAEFWMAIEKPELEAKQAPDCLTDYGIRGNVTMADIAQVRDYTWGYGPDRKRNLADLAIATRDMYLSRFLIRFEHEARLLEYGGDSPHIEPLVQPRHFDLALKKGFMEMAGEIIATTGVSLPLDHLVEKSGIKEVKKPKYYQGLMLYGKHKIEWFLSDTLARLYKQYCIDNKEETGLVALSKAHGGFDKAIHDWLYAKIDLPLHYAIQSDANHEKVVAVIEYLVRAIPATLESKDDVGLTPLALAFSKGKIDLVPSSSPSALTRQLEQRTAAISYTSFFPTTLRMPTTARGKSRECSRYSMRASSPKCWLLARPAILQA
ncbi:hypothetical protein MMC15_001654 [Xylographa vitiligo]|nr:hypothetical protein [Xylographa vitiligo]